MPAEVERKLAAILSADVVGYSRLMAEDEAGTIRTLGAYRDEIRLLVEQHRGRVADFTGDNFLAEFPTALDAVECAVEVQRVLKARNAGLPEGRRMEFRIGAHLGDVAVEGARLYGDGVNIAARLEGLAEPGGICISDDVLHQVQRKLELDFDDLGEQTVKNIPDPVHAYMLHERAAQAATPGAYLRIGTRPVVVGLAVIATVALAWWGWNRPVATTGPIRSIAVLPLENLSGDPEQDYFADGMTDTLISELVRLPMLRVISRTSIMQYKGVRRPLPEIASELGVEGILEGTVLRSGDQVRITLQLIDARSDHHLWADRYDRELAAVLQIHSEVARAVADQISLALTPGQAARFAPPPTVDPRAQDAYLRGLAQRNRFDPASMQRSIAAFEEASRIAPDYARPHAGQALSHVFLTFIGAPPLDEMPKARAAALRALELDDTLGEAHGSLGVVLFQFDWEWDAAEREFERAAELGVSDPMTRAASAFLYASAGRTAEALELFDEIVASAPLDLLVRGTQVALFMVLGLHERALAKVERILEIDPDDENTLRESIGIYTVLGRYEEGVQAALRYAKVRPEREQFAAELERQWRLHGREGYLRTMRKSREALGDAIGAAQMYAALGETDEAMAALERGYQERHGRVPFLNVDPAFDPLRSDPRFQDLLRRIGFPES